MTLDTKKWIDENCGLDSKKRKVDSDKVPPKWCPLPKEEKK